jgi:DNA-binding beta-propeller fold protein YncE
LRAREVRLIVFLLAFINGMSAAQWRVAADVPLPGKPGRFDYQSLDVTTGWLWIAHMGQGEALAFDVREHQVVARVLGMPGVTGIRVAPGSQLVFAALSASREVAVLDSRDGRVLARVAGGRFPDGPAYAPPVNKLFVSDEYGQQELVIDVPCFRARRPIPLGGEAGNTQYDSVTGRIWVAVQTRNQLIAIDPLTDSIVDRIPLPGIEHPHGFYLDTVHRLIYVTGERNAKLGILDLRERRILHLYPVGEEPDVLDLDPVRGRLYVAAELGVITAFDVHDRTLAPLPEYRASHAHSVAVDPATGFVYVPLENVSGRPTLRILRLE